MTLAETFFPKFYIIDFAVRITESETFLNYCFHKMNRLSKTVTLIWWTVKYEPVSTKNILSLTFCSDDSSNQSNNLEKFLMLGFTSRNHLTLDFNHNHFVVPKVWVWIFKDGLSIMWSFSIFLIILLLIRLRKIFQSIHMHIMHISYEFNILTILTTMTLNIQKWPLRQIAALRDPKIRILHQSARTTCSFLLFLSFILIRVPWC